MTDFGLLRCLPFAAALALTACAAAKDAPPMAAAAPGPCGLTEAGISDRTYCAVDRLLEGLPGRLPADAVILVASLADIDDLESSSSFGRLIAEQVGSRLVQNGHVVREVKLSTSLMVREQHGEFILSRDLKRIRENHGADIVVTGTYGKGLSQMYINLRMTRLADGVVLSAQDFAIARGADVIAMTTDLEDQVYLPGYPRR